MAYCPITLNGIAGSCDTSKGGVKKVYIAQFKDNIYTLDADGDYVDSVDSGTTWYEYVFKPGVSHFETTQTKDNPTSVNFYQTSLYIQFGRMDGAKRKEVNALSQGDTAIVVLDANGKYWALGFDSAVDGVVNDQTGTASSDGNFYGVTFTDESSQLPYELSADAVDSMNIHA